MMKSVYQTTEAWARQRPLNLRSFDEIGSTNDEAKAEAHSLDESPKLYLAAHQVRGRGRGGNVWLDTGAGESLLSSWSFHLPQPAQAITGPRVGEALFNSLSAAWPALEWSVKPPNDIYLGEHKVAGLLIETVSQGSTHRLIVGLGLNVLNHPRAISIATHLAGSSGETTVNEDEWYHFLDMLFAQLKAALNDVILPNLSSEVRSKLVKALNAFPLKKNPYLDVSPSGDLITKSGTVPWTAQ